MWRVKMLVLVCVAVTSLSCRGIVTWATVYESVSPTRDAELQVQVTGCFADCATQVVVKEGWRTRRIATGNDCIVTFAHAEWRGDIVAAFVDGGYCGPIKVAYDRRSRRDVDFAAAVPWLVASIARSYGVTAEELKAHNGNVFDWATYPGDGNSHRAMDEFRKRFPQ